MQEVLDPGHQYRLLTLDGDVEQILTFVKRCDPEHPDKFPGNTNAYPGTTLQSVIRACLDRVRHLQGQHACAENTQIVEKLGECLVLLEQRAARRHDVPFEKTLDQCEMEPMCPECGHVVCEHPKRAEPEAVEVLGGS